MRVMSHEPFVTVHCSLSTAHLVGAPLEKFPRGIPVFGYAVLLLHPVPPFYAPKIVLLKARCLGVADGLPEILGAERLDELLRRVVPERARLPRLPLQLNDNESLPRRWRKRAHHDLLRAEKIRRQRILHRADERPEETRVDLPVHRRAKNIADARGPVPESDLPGVRNHDRARGIEPMRELDLFSNPLLRPRGTLSERNERLILPLPGKHAATTLVALHNPPQVCEQFALLRLRGLRRCPGRNMALGPARELQPDGKEDRNAGALGLIELPVKILEAILAFTGFELVPVGNETQPSRAEIIHESPIILAPVKPKVAAEFLRERNAPNDRAARVRSGGANPFADGKEEEPGDDEDARADLSDEILTAETLGEDKSGEEKNNEVADVLGAIHERGLRKKDRDAHHDGANPGVAAVCKVEETPPGKGFRRRRADALAYARRRKHRERRQHPAHFDPEKSGDERCLGKRAFRYDVRSREQQCGEDDGAKHAPPEVPALRNDKDEAA